MWLPAMTILSHYKLKEKKVKFAFGVIRKYPEVAINGGLLRYLLNVDWKWTYGYNMFGRRKYFYVDGPLCPNCSIKMRGMEKGFFIKSKYWECANCNEYYKNRFSSTSEAKEFAENYLESLVRKGELDPDKKPKSQ
jgi:hypothetical protein